MTRVRARRSSLLEWPAAHPAAALLIAAVALGLAILGIRATSADTSIQALFPSDDPAAQALGRVLEDFPSADELLVLVSVPPADRRDDAPRASQRLLQYAERLERALRQDARSAGLVLSINYRVDAQTRQFFERVVGPAGMYYLDDRQFAEAQKRLTRTGMAEQMRRSEALLAAPGPAADALAQAVLADPLRLHEFLLERLAPLLPSGQLDPAGAFLSPDGQSLLIRLRGTRPPGDIEFAKRFTGTVADIAEQLNKGELELDITGAYAIAAASERAIRADMKSSVTSSIICLQILFIVAYRRPIRLFALAFAPIALGIVCGFGLHVLYSTTLAPPTAVVGAILAGVAIDYSVHYLSHYQAARAAGAGVVESAGQTSRQLGPSLLAAWATTILGFVAVGFSSVGALRDFAVVAGLGLTAALAATLFVLPALLRVVDRGAWPAGQTRLGLERLLTWLGGRHRPVLIAAGVCVAALAVVLAMPGEWPKLEDDMTVMHPRPNAPLDAQAKLAQRMGGAGDSLLVHLSARDPDRLVRLAHDVDRALADPQARQAGVRGTFGLATLLPDPELAARRRAAVAPERVEQIVADFRSALADSAFEPKAYEAYATGLRQLLSGPPVPGIETLTQFDTLASAVLSRRLLSGGDGPAEAITLVLLDRPLDQRPVREAAVAMIREQLRPLPGATLTGLSVVGHDMERSIQRDVPGVVLLSCGLVVIYLAVHYRSIRRAATAAVPMGLSLLALAAIMRLLDQRLNAMNLVSVPLLIGMTVDYGIFVESLRPRSRGDLPHLALSCHAIVICAASTMIGFGSLLGTSVPAIRSLGLAVAIGVGAALAGAMLVQVPMALRAATGRADRAAPAHSFS